MPNERARQEREAGSGSAQMAYFLHIGVSICRRGGHARLSALIEYDGSRVGFQAGLEALDERIFISGRRCRRAGLCRALCAGGRDAGAGIAAGRRSRGEAEARIDARARRLVESIRAHAGGLGGIEDFLHAYSLSTKEGLALMVLAEALLRVPDAATADALIEDKLAAGDWSQAEGSARSWSRPRPGRSASRRA